jgi:hypothetical protein
MLISIDSFSYNRIQLYLVITQFHKGRGNDKKSIERALEKVRRRE